VDVEHYSPEWKKLIESGRCPNGDRGRMSFVEGFGTRARLSPGERITYSALLRLAISVYAPWTIARVARAPDVTHLRRDSAFQCGQCDGRWPVFADAEQGTAEAVSMADPGSGQVVILGQVEARRTVTSLGDTDYVKDNRSSSIPMPAAIKISRRWQQRIEVDSANTQSRSTAGRAGLAISLAGLEVERTIERSLRDSLSLSAETEQIVEQTLEVTVPPGARLTVRLHWKQIWQEGDVRVRLADGTVAEIPYRAAVEVTFDQENIEG
jgi:hypothetical protein